MLEAWKTRLLKVQSEKPIEFPSITDFDPQKWFVMSDEFKKEQENNEYGLSVAHHMGKKVRL